MAKQLARQDRNGTRTSEELRRRYKLENIELTLDEVEYLKTLIVVDSALSTTSTNSVQNKVVTQALNNKVTIEAGKELSSNDFTTTFKNKLEGIEEQANNYVLPAATTDTLGGIKPDGTTITVTNGVASSVGSIDLLSVYPIGSIYMSVNNTNPGTLFGGTWASWGAGRVPVGIDTTQTEFDTVEETGGEKTVTLTVNQIPSHSHNTTIASGTLDSTQYAKANQGGTYTAIATSSTGGGQAHNNLQPYITCYMWKRTA